MTEHPFVQFAIALFIGALIGLEREKKKAAGGKLGIGGIRTFLLFAEAGAIAAWLALKFQAPVIFVGAGALVTAMVVVGYREDVRQHPTDYGLTTEMAALVVFLLGGMVLYGYAEVAVGLAIATLAALAWKEPLHAFIHGLDTDDIFAGLKLLIATFIVLPVLPNRVLDPWGALNPYKIWLLVVLISALSLVGYAAARWMGERKGIALTGLVGGVVSSTAVTLAFTRRSREPGGDAMSGPLASGIVLAWAVMFARVGVIVAAVNQPLAWHLATPLAVLTLASLALAWAFARHAHVAHPQRVAVPLKNPFSLTSAIHFALLFTGVLLIVKLGEHYLPASALYVVATVAGLTDVDAITLSMSDYARATGAVATAAAAIAIGWVANTAFKCGIVAMLGSRALLRRIAAATAVLVMATIGSFFMR